MSAARLDRREFLGTLGRQAGGVCLACALAPLAGRALADSPGQFTREVDFYKQLPDDKIQCFVCPLHCVLEDGETCFCRTRTNVGGKLFTRAHDNPCILQVDPIEKLPLNHFRPGIKTLAIGTGGCNLRCLYCQNWEQSQKMPDEVRTFSLTAREAVAAARKRKVDTIAFAYTEPIAFLEYAHDIAKRARRARMKVVVATAAYVDPEPLLDLAKYVDAFVIGLKGFSEEFYHTVTGVQLAPVLKAIETIKTRTKCWLELVNLMIPTYNDSPEQIGGLVEWVHNRVGDDVPLHFARYVPKYRLTNLPRTPVPTLESACRTARKAGLRHVYTSNIAPHAGTNTVCPKCGQTLIERLGFKVLTNRMDAGVCPHCGHKLPGVWA